MHRKQLSCTEAIMGGGGKKARERVEFSDTSIWLIECFVQLTMRQDCQIQNSVSLCTAYIVSLTLTVLYTLSHIFINNQIPFYVLLLQNESVWGKMCAHKQGFWKAFNSILYQKSIAMNYIFDTRGSVFVSKLTLFFNRFPQTYSWFMDSPLHQVTLDNVLRDTMMAKLTYFSSLETW